MVWWTARLWEPWKSFKGTWLESRSLEWIRQDTDMSDSCLKTVSNTRDETAQTEGASIIQVREDGSKRYCGLGTHRTRWLHMEVREELGMTPKLLAQVTRWMMMPFPDTKSPERKTHLEREMIRQLYFPKDGHHNIFHPTCSYETNPCHFPTQEGKFNSPFPWIRADLTDFPDQEDVVEVTSCPMSKVRRFITSVWVSWNAPSWDTSLQNQLLCAEKSKPRGMLWSTATVELQPTHSTNCQPWEWATLDFQLSGAFQQPQLTSESSCMKHPGTNIRISQSIYRIIRGNINCSLKPLNLDMPYYVVIESQSSWRIQS